MFAASLSSTTSSTLSVDSDTLGSGDCLPGTNGDIRYRVPHVLAVSTCSTHSESSLPAASVAALGGGGHHGSAGNVLVPVPTTRLAAPDGEAGGRSGSLRAHSHDAIHTSASSSTPLSHRTGSAGESLQTSGAGGAETDSSAGDSGNGNIKLLSLSAAAARSRPTASAGHLDRNTLSPLRVPSDHALGPGNRAISAPGNLAEDGGDTPTSSSLSATPARHGSAFALRDPRVAPVSPADAAQMTPIERLAALSGLIRSFADVSTAGETETVEASPVVVDFSKSTPAAQPSTPQQQQQQPPASLPAYPTPSLGATGEGHIHVASLRPVAMTSTPAMYAMQRTLVEGSAGKIKLATHVLTGESVVVKCLDKATLQLDPASWHAAMREIAVTASLAHPNIASLLQVMDTPTAVQLVFQFEPGGDLLEYLVNHARERTAQVERALRADRERGAAPVASATVGAGTGSQLRLLSDGQLPDELRTGMSESRARHLVAQVAHALEYCHSRGIVHRDLKPDNILINGDGQVQLIDFGFTNILESQHQLMTTFCGSISYSAPEMLAKQPYAGMPADIWSLGVSLFVMVTGYLPFDEGNLVRMYQQMMAGQIDFPSTMSSDLRALIVHMLNPDPLKRATIHEVQSAAWFALERADCPHLFVPSETPAECTDPDTPLPPPPRVPINEALVRSMCQQFPSEFPDPHRVRALAATRTPSLEFATYTLLAERLRRSPRDAQQHPAVVPPADADAQWPAASPAPAARWHAFARNSLVALEQELASRAEAAEDDGGDGGCDGTDGCARCEALPEGEADFAGGLGSQQARGGIPPRPQRSMTILEEEEEEED
ncbi:hypothetical protein H9P43_006504 [Blastocladiella emersonii ATCC 22665]|nr:hypothetical protein H9P43_006504 [Blastocladiella emersonii ATCC 22665]